MAYLCRLIQDFLKAIEWGQWNALPHRYWLTGKAVCALTPDISTPRIFNPGKNKKTPELPLFTSGVTCLHNN